ncbi:MAG: hypothetical protein M1438_00870 [Deltaproteobacteria bacterium]|nr:hypothetical protein [Deltaproteobacteria bacterium]
MAFLARLKMAARSFIPGCILVAVISSLPRMYQELSKKLKIAYVSAIIYVLAWLGIIGWFVHPIFMFLGIVPFALWTYGQCRHLERAEERLENNEKFAELVHKNSLLELRLRVIYCIGMVVFGICAIAFKKLNPTLLFGAVFIIIYCGSMAFLYFRLLKAKKRKAANS